MLCILQGWNQYLCLLWPYRFGRPGAVIGGIGHSTPDEVVHRFSAVSRRVQLGRKGMVYPKWQATLARDSTVFNDNMTLGNWFHQKVYRRLTYGTTVQQIDDSWFASLFQHGTAEYCDKKSQHGTRKYPRNMYCISYGTSWYFSRNPDVIHPHPPHLQSVGWLLRYQL